MKRLAPLFVCFALVFACQARTITVDDDSPADFSNIQAGIDDANDGDVIEVKPGTYTGPGNRGLDFNGKAITVKSTDPNDANVVAGTVIDCQDSDLGFYFHSGEDANSVVAGLTITHGFAHGGAGILCNNTSPTIANCTITENTAMRSGGGIACLYGNPLISRCTISSNQAPDSGGGIVCHGKLRISNCIITDNWATCGGGVSITDDWATCGGGVSSIGDETGISQAELINCTLSANTAEYGGALYCGELGYAKLTNCIFWGDSATYGPEITMHSGDWGSDLSAWYSNIQFGESGVFFESASVYPIDLDWSEGNIDTDPCFADPHNHDYHLKSQAGRWDPNSESWVLDGVTSPCIDKANPGCPVGGEPTPNGNRRNMGAYGGTTEASKSPEGWSILADLTNDRSVDGNDLRVLVDYWLEEGECIPGDLDGSRLVDFADFALLGLEWSQAYLKEPGMTYEIGDCNMSPAGTDSNEPRFSVRVEGAFICFEDMMYANCCPEALWLEMTVQGNAITMKEMELTLIPCDCMCYFPISARLGPFKPGIYTVEAYDNYGQYLGIVEVVIGGPHEPGMAYSIGECDMGATAPLEAGDSNQPRFTIRVDGLYICFEDTMIANCCPEALWLEMTVEENRITIHEMEYTPGGCYCICDYPMKATLGPFEPGTYTVEVFDNYGQSLGTVEVVIGGESKPGMSYRIDQCDMEASSVEAQQEEQTRFSVAVDGCYIHFEDMMVANCCPDRLELEMTVEDGLITIHEIEYTTSPCRCTCDFPIQATLGPFEPGTYTIEVYQGDCFVGSTTVEVGPCN